MHVAVEHMHVAFVCARLTKVLLSVGSIEDDGYKLFFDFGQMHILKNFDLADISCILASGS